VIARYWSAHASRAQAPAYARHLRNSVLPALRTLEGYDSAMLLERETLDGVEIVVITFWHTLDSIRAFAGADLEAAVVADEAAAILSDFDQRARHYEVIVKDEGHTQ
jgi:heme-degrading monooxygenase HmoA